MLVERLRVALVPALNGVGVGRGAESHEFLGYGLPEVTGYLLIIVLPTVYLADLLTAAKGYLRFQNLQELLLGTCPYKILKLVQNSEKSRYVLLNFYNNILRCFPFFGLIF